MSIIIITKGKLLKGDIVEVEYVKKDSAADKGAKCTEERKNCPPSKEFREAFAALSIHAALLGEFISPSSVPDIDNHDAALVKDFNTSGFSISGEDDTEGVIITAQKILKSGKSLGFNTPLIRYQDESETAYLFMDELIDCIDACKRRVREYLEGKRAEDPQGKLFGEEASKN